MVVNKSLYRLVREDAEQNEFALVEKVFLALFTTVPGKSITSGLIKVAMGQHEEDCSDLKSCDPCWQNLYKSWRCNRHILDLFLNWMIMIETDEIDLSKYSRPTFKNALRFLLLGADPGFTVPLWNESNLVEEYLQHASPLIQKQLLAMNGERMAHIISKYRRLYEFCGVFSVFDVDPQFQDYYALKCLPNSGIALLEKYCTVILDSRTMDNDIRPFLMEQFEALFAAGILPTSMVSSTIMSTMTDAAASAAASASASTSSQCILPDIKHWLPKKEPPKKQPLEGPFPMFEALGLDQFNTPLMLPQFSLLISFSHPKNHPPPNDKNIISLDLLHEMYIGALSKHISKLSICYQPIWRDLACSNLEIIITRILVYLKLWDYEQLQEIEIRTESDPESCFENLSEWVPKNITYADVEIYYMVLAMCFYSLYKLNSDQLPKLNPSLPLLLRAWKCLTTILMIGLELDRYQESQVNYRTPVVVRSIIRSASAVRALVATILNGHMDKRAHDFKHEPFSAFMSPHGRKVCNGALFTSQLALFTALWPLNDDFEETVDLINEVQRGDRIDEDVRYMFDYEYYDFNDADIDRLDEDDAMFLSTKQELEDRKRFRLLRGFYKRCHCKFSNDDEEEDGDDRESMENNDTNNDNDYDENNNNTNNNNKSNNNNNYNDKNRNNRDNRNGVDLNDDEEDENGFTLDVFKRIIASGNKTRLTPRPENQEQERTSENSAVSSESQGPAKHLKQNIDASLTNPHINSKGEDWRDIPRGSNLYYNENFSFATKVFKDGTLWGLKTLSLGTLQKDESLELIRGIATVVRVEQEQLLAKRFGKTSEFFDSTEVEVTSEEIIEATFKDGSKENLSFIPWNESLGWKILDELLMSHNHRRLLIYRLAHAHHSYDSVHYIYELLFGLRGNTLKKYESESSKNKQLDFASGVNMGSFDRCADIEFSRQGVIQLSMIEKKMLLQEFFMTIIRSVHNGWKHAESQDTTIPAAQRMANKEFLAPAVYMKACILGMVKMVCFILEELLNDKEYEFVAQEDYVFELESFLTTWSSLSPEACSVYSLLKAKMTARSLGNSEKDDTSALDLEEYEQSLSIDLSRVDLDSVETATGLSDTYNFKGHTVPMKSIAKQFSRILPVDVIEGKPAEKVYKYLSNTYPLTASAPVYGKEVIEYHDEILPMDPKNDHLLYREFLALFGINYMDVLESQQQEAEEESDDIII